MKEIIYWSAIVGIAAYAVWRHNRKPVNAERERGVADARRYLRAGVFPASIQSYVAIQRARGLGGEYESGLLSVVGLLREGE